MSLDYGSFTGAFLHKINEYEFQHLVNDERNDITDRYMKSAIASFRKICEYDLSTTADDSLREFDVEVSDEDIDELLDIISEGMVYYWTKPYTFNQDNLQNLINTKDYSTYSPGELLKQIKALHDSTGRRFTNMMREYSYNHGDLTDLHL